MTAAPPLTVWLIVDADGEAMGCADEAAMRRLWAGSRWRPGARLVECRGSDLRTVEAAP